LEAVKLLHRADAAGVEFIAAGAEDVLDDVTVLKCIVDRREGS